MGTSKSGRYMRTNGGRYTVSDFAVVHSDEGKFKHSLIYKDNKHITVLVLASGGHGQKGMDLLDKYRIEYHITKTYSNGVRIGEVLIPSRLRGRIKKQAWFPKTWTEDDIRQAGEYVAGLKHNINSDAPSLMAHGEGFMLGLSLLMVQSVQYFLCTNSLSQN